MAASRNDLFTVLFSEIKVENDFNVRYDYGDIEELCESIVENGIQNPIHAYAKTGEINKYTLIEGHRRLKAVELAIKKKLIDPLTFRIPMVKVRAMSDENRNLGLITYNSGKPLTLLEEATVYDRVVNYGMSIPDIAKKVGKSPTHISNCLTLMSANLGTKKMIMDGTVAATLVIEMLKKKTPLEVEKELKEVKETLTTIPAISSEDTAPVKSEKSDNTDILPKKDNTKTTGKDTRQMKEANGKPVKITKKVLNSDKPKNIDAIEFVKWLVDTENIHRVAHGDSVIEQVYLEYKSDKK